MAPGRREHHIFSRYFALFITFILFIPVSSQAQMSRMSESELSEVSARSGVSYVIGGSQLRITSDSYRISDTDHTPYHWMEFNNVTIDDGEGGGFSMDTPYNYDDFNTLDIATGADGKTFIFMNLSTHVEPRTYTVGNFVFCGQDLGGMELKNLRKGASDALTIASRGAGQSGIDIEYQTEITLDSLQYTYNAQSASLNLAGIHLAGTAGGSPEDPTSWIFLDKFKIGDLANNRPVTIDVGTYDNDGVPSTSIFYNVPMSGSIRVEDVDFGGNRFGPCAIDGITVHHLGIQIPGN